MTISLADTLGSVPQTMSIGPFVLTRLDEDNFILTYVQDEDDPESWDKLLVEVPEFARAHQIDAVSLDIDHHCVCVEHWRLPSRTMFVVLGG